MTAASTGRRLMWEGGDQLGWSSALFLVIYFFETGPWLSWRSACLCPPMTGIKGVTTTACLDLSFPTKRTLAQGSRMKRTPTSFSG